MTPGRLDAAVVRRHLLALDQALQVLRHHQGRSVEELWANQEERWIVERGLQLCAQNALDVATHLVASTGRDAADYTAAIDHLAEMGVLPHDFTARFRGVAGFRNVVVHAYLEVDVPLLHRLLNNHLEDFAVFAQHIENYLARPLGDS
jgi:uncharacterized protein YutE (UPF0331/DUF86 family)